MRTSILAVPLLTVATLGWCQDSKPVTFEIASVKLSDRQVGPDYNNQLTFSTAGITGSHLTLRWLVAEAYRVQLTQVIGPDGLDRNEYELTARAARPGSRAEMDLMLRSLLEQRFDLKHHSETREMRVHTLVTDKSGPKIHAMKEGETPQVTGGLRFRGEMRQFADFLAVQLSIPAADDPTKPAIGGGPMIPVLDKTGLTGTYDIDADLKPELGTDAFTLWKRVLPERLGLRLATGPDRVEVVVVDSALKIPAAN